MATTLDLPPPPPSCLSHEALYWDAAGAGPGPAHAHSHAHLHHRALRPCKSVPEGLARFAWMPPYPVARPARNVTVVEQMTTSV
ncbi:Protein of unknown function [Gryllus bimaculatus]|nr:Protein of unknown function [Gryllus bimaculatus]